MPAAAAQRPIQTASANAKPKPARTTDGGTPGPWGIQVGAFHRINLAQDAALKATEVAAGLLENREVRIVPSDGKKKKPLYRARIVGLTKEDAERACAALRKKAMDCLAMPDAGFAVAATSTS
jgi:D-alanyl-D-alanine carboxypeptidase